MSDDTSRRTGPDSAPDGERRGGGADPIGLWRDAVALHRAASAAQRVMAHGQTATLDGLLDAILPEDPQEEARVARALEMAPAFLSRLRRGDMDPFEVPPVVLAALGWSLRLEQQQMWALVTRTRRAHVGAEWPTPPDAAAVFEDAWARAALDDPSSDAAPAELPAAALALPHAAAMVPFAAASGAADLVAPPLDERLRALVEMLADAVRANKTPEEARRRLLMVTPNAADVEAAYAAFQAEAKRYRELKEPNTIVDTNLPTPWYQGPREQDICWKSLQQQLLHQGLESRQPGSLQALDQASNRILSLLPHPGTEEFATRGLVIGYVQSGKTANLTSVIAKAADAGYRAFFILSGMTSALRRQTQSRLERDLTKPIRQKWLWLTERNQDFWKESSDPVAYLSEGQNMHVIAVVKKNAKVLEKLTKWLSDADRDVRASCPVLVIDDEADQASPNASGKKDVRTRVNQQIMEMLEILPKCAYVGYTATPFANLLIDTEPEHDLYPRDFIIDLPKPPSYFGPEYMFGREPLEGEEPGIAAAGLDMIRRIDDAEIPSLRPTRANKATFLPTVTPSVESALRYFVLATAARWARGQREEHSTMLVHSSESVAVHRNWEAPLQAAAESLARRLARDDQKLLDALRDDWAKEQQRVPSNSVNSTVKLRPVPFGELRPHLAEVARKIDIRLEHGGGTKRLSYDEDPKGGVYIVVGGNVVSRGLTLEGLVVTHFVRSAGAYDTLLQMGRWFGYRVGYEDLPRIWLPDSLRGFFRHLALVEQEIRYAVARYKDGVLTPREFAVRIRTHPLLAVTSRLKMVHAKTRQVSFAGDAPQTILFNANDRTWLQENCDAAEALVSRIRRRGTEFQPHGSDRVALGVGADLILQFLNEYHIHESAALQQQPLRNYIRAQNAKQNLLMWNVAVVGTKRSTLGTIDLGLGRPVPLINRSAVGRRADGATDIRALMSALDVVVDLDKQLVTRVRAEARAAGQRMTRQDWVAFRNQQQQNSGLLLLYPIAKNSKAPAGADPRDPDGRRDLDAADHVIGLGLVFPDPRDNTPQSYVEANLPDIEWDETYEEDDIEDFDDEEVAA